MRLGADSRQRQRDGMESGMRGDWLGLGSAQSGAAAGRSQRLLAPTPEMTLPERGQNVGLDVLPWYVHESRKELAIVCTRDKQAVLF